jgi:hypothetical protein
MLLIVDSLVGCLVVSGLTPGFNSFLGYIPAVSPPNRVPGSPTSTNQFLRKRLTAFLT